MTNTQLSMDLYNALRCAGTTITHSVALRLFQRILLCTDSQSAIHIVRNLEFHEETKHIEGDRSLLREKIQRGVIITYHVKSDEQLTDSHSKAFNNSLCVFECDGFCSIDTHMRNIGGSARNVEDAKRTIFDIE